MTEVEAEAATEAAGKAENASNALRMQNAAFNTFERKRIQVADLTHSK